MTLKTIRNGIHNIDKYLNVALDLFGGQDGLCHYECSDGKVSQATQSVLVGNGTKNMAITTLLIMQTSHLLKSSVESDYVPQTKPLSWYSATPNTHCSFSEQVVSLNKIKEEL
jgi:hypothetical protein